MSTTQMNARLTASTRPSSFAAWMQAHPLVAYFTLAFTGTWLMVLPMVLGKDGLGLFSYNVPMAVYLVLFILGSYAGPTLAAYLVTNALDGKAGMRKLLSRYAQWRFGLRWYLLAFLGFPIIYLTAAGIVLHGAPLAALGANWITFFSAYLPAVLIFPAFITWGEEPGWRGFALTRMQERYNPLVAGLVVGFMHGLWHLPIFLLVTGPVALGPFSLTGFAINVVAIMAISILWTWVFNNAKGSILIAVLLHASLNASQSWMGMLVPHFPKAAGEIAFGFYIVAVLALILITKGRLGYRPGQSDQIMEKVQ